MAIAMTPTNFYVQQGNAQVYLLWDIVAGATTYNIQRSIDGVTFTTLTSPATNYYLDTTVTANTLYYYQVASVNASGTSAYTTPQKVIPCQTGQMSLMEVRLRAQQRADRVGSNFVTLPEWNSYINQSNFELYDLLVTTYEDYYVAASITITASGTSNLYPLPTGANYSGAPAFDKLLGVDCGPSGGGNGYITLGRFNFIDRNKYTFPYSTSSYSGYFNIQYKVLGTNIMFIPTPIGNQTLRIWYIPRMTTLLQETDILDGQNGWLEYVIVDAAIKALDKEESDTSMLRMNKANLLKRIEDSASDRDAGQPVTISQTRSAKDSFYSQGDTGAGW